MERDNLYPSQRARMPVSDVVNLMRKNILIRRLQTKDGKPASGFILEFVYPDPHVAQRVDGELVSGLVSMNLRIRIAGAATSDFLKDELLAARDPATKTRMQSQLLQSEAVSSQFPKTFRVLNAASLPNRPTGLGRIELGMIGLLAGLVGGMIAAAIFGSHRRATI